MLVSLVCGYSVALVANSGNNCAQGPETSVPPILMNMLAGSPTPNAPGNFIHRGGVGPSIEVNDAYGQWSL